jgi:hypothetical protein
MKKHKCPCENPAEESGVNWYRRAVFSTSKPVSGNRKMEAEVYSYFFPSGEEFSIRIGIRNPYSPLPESKSHDWILEMGRKFGGGRLNREQAGAVIEATIPRSQWIGDGQNALDLYAGRPVDQKNVIRENMSPPRKTYGWIQVRHSDRTVVDRPILSKQGDFAVYANANDGDIPKKEIRYTVHNTKTDKEVKSSIMRLKDAIEVAKQMNGD